MITTPDTCLQLERKIKQLAKTKTLYDPELRKLRSQLKSACQNLLLSHLPTGQVRVSLSLLLLD
jgi:hypothetical protein